MKRNRIVPIILLSVLFSVFSVVIINMIYSQNEENVLKERDDQLFSLAYSVDQGITQRLEEFKADLLYSVQGEDFNKLEEALLEEGRSEDMEINISRAEIMTEDCMNAVAVFQDDTQLLVIDSSGDTNTHSYTFLDTTESGQYYVCYDEAGDYHVAVEVDSFNHKELQYYAILSLDHFYHMIIPPSLNESHWIVFYEQSTGLTLQSHDNQEPWQVFTEEELLERNDGYTIIMKSQKKKEKSAVTYMYPNYKMKNVRERIITLPVEETENGFFTIGISRDSESLYRELDHSKQLMILSILILTAGTFLLIVYVFTYQYKVEREAREMERQKQEAAMNEMMVQAQLDNSVHQLQPHFLYNSLSSIREIVLESPEYAADLLLDFTNYLRACLRAMSKKELIPFGQELDNIKAYVNIEKMRLGERLTVIYDIQVEDFDIIALGVQPLVENAIRHGICKKRNKTGTVWIRTRKTDEYYEISIEDNGTGFDMPKKKAELESGKSDSTGLKNLVLRYEKLMNAKVEGISEIGKGTKIWIQIPISTR